MTRKSQMPTELLFQLFDFAFGVGPNWADSWQAPPSPTDDDIREVEQTLNIRLPTLLVELSRTTPYFTRWFAELGPSRTSDRHIISINEWLKEEGKPEDLVIINQAYDGDCDGISQRAENPDESPVVYVAANVWGEGGFSDRRTLAPDFRSYLQNLCLQNASSGVKSLRRKAKRLIAEWRESGS